METLFAGFHVSLAAVRAWCPSRNGPREMSRIVPLQMSPCNRHMCVPGLDGG